MIAQWRIALPLGVLGVAALIGLGAYRYSPRTLPIVDNRGLPEAEIESGRIVLRVPGSRVMGELARYDDELFAYLMFDYLRQRNTSPGAELLLTYSSEGSMITYSILVVLPNDILRGCPTLIAWRSQLPFLKPVCFFDRDPLLAAYRLHTDTLIHAYNYPAYHTLEQLSDRQVIAYTRRFIRFKSTTDPRILRQIEPPPHPLTRGEAETLAADIVAVARFYSLPLDFFLGIGAMENNYMNVKGDLGRAIWKRKVGKGDVVLQRRNGRIQVLNEAMGVWQITRETLRYTHELYLRDTRDYTMLPEYLRPSADLDLDIDALDARVLTTYAGLLFRDLLDRFDGNAQEAIGAYNGGPGNPNMRYAAGVDRVAQYARRVMEAAATVRSKLPIERRSTSER